MGKPSTKGLLKEILSDELERVYIDITNKAVEWAVAGFIDETNDLLEQLWSFKIPHSGHLWLPDEGLQIMWQVSGKLPAGIPFEFKDVEGIEQENWSRVFYECGDLETRSRILSKPFAELEGQELFFKVINTGYDNSETPEAILAALKRLVGPDGDMDFHSATCGALLSARNDWRSAAEYFIMRWGEGYSKNWSGYILSYLMRDRKTAECLLTEILAPVFGLTAELCKSETREIIDTLSKRMAVGRSLVYGGLSWPIILSRISILSEMNLSRSPATKEEIAAAEKRLGVSLPDDYKDFLLSSNGFGQYLSTGVGLVGIDRVDFLVNVNKELVDIWTEDNDDTVFCEKFRNSIIIGGHDDEQELLIVPLENGSSECWEFATWRAGETIYPSFRFFMEKELQLLEDGFFKD